MLEILHKSKKLFTNKLTIRLSRYLVVLIFIFLSFLILNRSSFVRGIFNLYLAAFFLWLGAYIYCRLETKVLVFIGLALLLFLPVMLILEKDYLVIEDLSIYVYEIFALAILQELINKYKKK